VKYALFDVVRIKRIVAPVPEITPLDMRAPCIGDVATIVEVYSDPPGYELECANADGITQWLNAFAPHSVELELVQ
jgi:hypothetical protein